MVKIGDTITTITGRFITGVVKKVEQDTVTIEVPSGEWTIVSRFWVNGEACYSKAP